MKKYPPTKRCSRCKTPKDRSEFWPNPHRTDGLNAYCKGCWREYTRLRMRVYRQRPEVKRKNCQYMRAYRKTEKGKAYFNNYHREYRRLHRDACNAGHKRWRTAHRDHFLARMQRYRETHHAKIRRWWKKHYDTHKASILASQRYRRLHNLQWLFISAVYQSRCYYCGKRLQSLTKDHIIPRAKGGLNILSNLVPACHSCNSRKNVGPPPIPVQPLLDFEIM